MRETAGFLTFDAFFRHWAAERGDAIAHQLRVLGTGTMEPLWDRLPELHAPVRLVTGTTDLKFRAAAEAMLPLLPDATHEELPGGHGLIGEQPVALAAIIQAFANR